MAQGEKQDVSEAPSRWKLQLEYLDIDELDCLKITTSESIYVISHLRWVDDSIYGVLDASHKAYSYENIADFPDNRFFYECDFMIKGLF